MIRLVLGAGLAALASEASAEVKAASEHGFEIEYRSDSEVTPGALYRAFSDLPRWWGKDHTYSGDSANLRLELKPGGCWCERLANNGGVEHMRVAYLDPGNSIILTGSLGPLLGEATAGVMQVSFLAREGGSTLVLNYRVAGFAKGGASKLAPLVDKVLGIQVTRLDAFVGERGDRR